MRVIRLKSSWVPVLASKRIKDLNEALVKSQQSNINLEWKVLARPTSKSKLFQRIALSSRRDLGRVPQKTGFKEPSSCRWKELKARALFGNNHKGSTSMRLLCFVAKIINLVLTWRYTPDPMAPSTFVESVEAIILQQKSLSRERFEKSAMPMKLEWMLPEHHFRKCRHCTKRKVNSTEFKHVCVLVPQMRSPTWEVFQVSKVPIAIVLTIVGVSHGHQPVERLSPNLSWKGNAKALT
mmetsp:Transcript_97659/g.273267  ORF Transcript_97659/g.273267 Transcript_97659/m.273267 type:complete len:238 (-) Transcript_97659:165-878(-)